MPSNIKNDEVDRLVYELSSLTKESFTDAIRMSLRERLDRIKGRHREEVQRMEILRIQTRMSSLTLLDSRTDDQILGHGAEGLPS